MPLLQAVVDGLKSKGIKEFAATGYCFVCSPLLPPFGSVLMGLSCDLIRVVNMSWNSLKRSEDFVLLEFSRI